MNYQKYYSSQIHSSALLCQLAQLWKSQTMCDAIIKTGNINTKAHRLVLVAACPMLQSMDNAAIGSHLEVRLAPDIKQDSVNMFLQFLYEGYMVLAEDNAKDIEKIARLLQVDSIIKCCADFFKTLQEKTGLPVYNAGQYKYTSYDMLEFRHMRVSSMQKSVSETANKRQRVSEFGGPGSPGNKRSRTHRQESPSGDYSDNYRSSHHNSDSYDRVPRLGLGSSHGASGRRAQQGVDIVEDSIEIVQTEPMERDPVTGRPMGSRPQVQKSVSVSVSSQVQGEPELQIVNVSSLRDHQSSTSHSSVSSPQRGHQPQRHPPDPTSPSMSRSHHDIPSRSHPASQSLPSPRTEQQRQTLSEIRPSNNQFNVSSLDLDFTKPKPMEVQSSQSMGNKSQNKPYAAGSASQATPSPPTNIPLSTTSMSQPSTSQEMPELAPSSTSANAPRQSSSQYDENYEQDESSRQSDMGSRSKSPVVDLAGPDLSIVKIEATGMKVETGGLDMYVDTHLDGAANMSGMNEYGEQYDGSDYDVEEPPGEMDGSNDASNLSGDQNWYLGNVKALPPTKRQRTQLTVFEKCELVTFKDENPQTTLEDIAEHFIKKWGKPIGKSTVGDIIKSRAKLEERIETNRLCYRQGKYAELESSLVAWIVEASKYMHVADKMIVGKAKEIGEAQGITDFRYSPGWLQRFKKRQWMNLRKDNLVTFNEFSDSMIDIKPLANPAE